MEQIQKSLKSLQSLPNSTTLSVQQIAKTETIIKGQLKSLETSKDKLLVVEKQYQQLLKRTKTKELVDRLDKIQPYTEVLDQELRILETTVAILAENEQYK